MPVSPVNGKVTIAQLLIPVSLTAFVLFLVLAFQVTQIMRDHTVLSNTKTEQQKPLDQATKVQSQLEALALGTKKLAQGGDKNAQAIVAKLEQAGISIGGPQGAGAPPAPPAPAAP